MQRNVKIMQRSVTRTAQWIDVCPDCRSVLKLALIEAHPNHDKLGIYRFRCENCGKSTSKTIVGRLNSLPPIIQYLPVITDLPKRQGKTRERVFVPSIPVTHSRVIAVLRSHASELLRRDILSPSQRIAGGVGMQIVALTGAAGTLTYPSHTHGQQVSQACCAVIAGGAGQRQSNFSCCRLHRSSAAAFWR
jgi:hypothetical protein